VKDKLNRRLESLPETAKILDVGGWFIPCPMATHVVDIMPWETRGAKLQTKPLLEEKFSKETWFQIDFLDPKLRLPFSDNEFDFSICSHTLEDLIEPSYLMKELMRVNQAGYIEVPSRLTEQTIGVEDAEHRSCSVVGYSHHHWIVDSVSKTLTFYSKPNSIRKDGATIIPLSTFEREVAEKPDAQFLSFFWEGSFSCEFVRGAAAGIRAREFRKSLSIRGVEVWEDRLKRMGRRARKKLKGGASADLDARWQEIVDLSQPYSSLKLR